MKKLLTLVCCFAFLYSSQAQLGNEWRGYPAATGGTFGALTIIDSVLWLSSGGFSDYGLVKYDTRTGRQELSSEMNLSTPVKDQNGKLWSRSGNQLYTFNNGKWELFPIPANVSDLNTPVGNFNTFYDLAFDVNNNLWIAAVYNVWKYDGTTWTSFATPTIGINSAHSVSVDSQNVVWIGAEDLSIASYNGTAWTAYGTSDHGLIAIFNTYIIGETYVDASNKKWWGLRCNSSNCSVNELYLTYNDTIWEVLTAADFNNTLVGRTLLTGNGTTFWALGGSNFNELFMYNSNGWASYIGNLYGISSTIHALTVGSSGKAWLNNHLRGFSFDGTTATSFNFGVNSSSRSSRPLRDLSRTGTGKMWWINGEVGQINFDQSTVALAEELAFTLDTGASFSIKNNYYSHIEYLTDSNIWVANTGLYPGITMTFDEDTLALFHFDGTSWSENKIDTQIAPYATRVLGMAIHNNDVWLATPSQGLINWNGATWSSNYPAPLNTNVEQIVATNTGVLWLSAGNQIFQYDGSSITTYDHTNTSMPDALITSLEYDNATNTLWAATDSAGLLKYNNSWTVYDTQNSGIATNNLLALAQRETGEVWIGTQDSGLVYYDGNTTWKTITTTTPNSPMVENKVSTLEVDNNGNVWFYNFQFLLVYQEGGLVNVSQLPVATATLQSNSYPNPFSQSSTIQYNLATTAQVSLQIYDLQGKLIEQVLQGQEQPQGQQQVTWQPSNQVPAGLYIYAIFVEGQLAGQGKVVYNR